MVELTQLTLYLSYVVSLPQALVKTLVKNLAKNLRVILIIRSEG